ncbi:MAG: response regulator [Polyangiaceae bacterium]
MNKTGMASRPLRILLADDDEGLRNVVGRLAELRGHQLTWAATGGSTVAAAVALQPDAIVLDMDFPDADGRDILCQLKSDDRTKRIPVVVWSGRSARESDSRIALDSGAEAYIEKGAASLLLSKLERLSLRIDEEQLRPPGAALKSVV